MTGATIKIPYSEETKEARALKEPFEEKKG